MFHPQDTIGPYTLLRELGRGSFGVVWLARERGLLQREVALKLSLEEYPDLETVQTEAQTWLRAGNHPNVVAVLNADVYDGQVVIASEYVSGGTLHEWLQRHGGLSPSAEAGAQMIAGILAGLVHLHNLPQPIIHRDLKPANILLNGEIPRLTDFGISRVLKNTATEISGTPTYMAPEMFEGRYSPQSDLWAAGILLYRILTGLLPFQKASNPVQQARIIERDSPAPLPDTLPAPLREVMERALQKEPSERFGAAKEMQEALQSAMMQEQETPNRLSARPVVVSSATPPPSHRQASQRTSQATHTQTPQRPPFKIALLYKRNAQPDMRLLGLLETELKAQGFQVFIDRHLTIGVEWAQAIEREIRGADAVIALLSASNVQSEMLAYEIQTAHKAAQERGGKPRILPVRIAFDGPLPEELAARLDSLQYTLWEGPQDDARLVEEIIRSLTAPPPPRPAEALEPIGGAVPLDSKFYIERSADADFKTAIVRRDSIVLVKGARQMGKTSLLARGLQTAREAGAKVAFTDFQSLDSATLESEDTYFIALARSLKLQLELDVSIKRVWDEDLSPNMNMEWFLRRYVLGSIREPLVWGLDEVDRLFTCSFGSDVFALFRSWHNKRALDPTGPWSRLTLAIAYATEAHLFIRDVNQSPFNVGTRLTLDDFSPAQTAELNARYGEPLQNEAELARFYRLLSGHPYLVRRGLDLMAAQELAFDTLEAQADRDEGPFGDHLRRILVLLSQDTPLLEAVRTLLRGQPCPDEESFYRLRSAGLFTGDSPARMQPRCGLYASYLTRHLL